ncbi:copper homeostasis periplasmic binding protein CopC [Brevundimonas vesicularis]|uniref:copper homeostasis periplasmic binding protein CopC n=1 Tax=Brevundimonas vesicularis TaxID=41276 RepID=UPI000830087C|nr:copper homeostasis periplasmic binding protein CopC [Brevundimonas vesicularis]
MTRFKIATFAASIAALSLFASQADAHARLVSATPAAGSTVSAPRTITLTFSERMVPAFSGFDVVNAAGATIPVRTQVSDDGKTVSGAPARALPAGAYTVNWRVASPDGHRMTGTTNFVVR